MFSTQFEALSGCIRGQEFVIVMSKKSPHSYVQEIASGDGGIMGGTDMHGHTGETCMATQ